MRANYEDKQFYDKDNKLLKTGDRVRWCLDYHDSKGEKHYESEILTVKMTNDILKISMIDKNGWENAHLVKQETITLLE